MHELSGRGGLQEKKHWYQRCCCCCGAASEWQKTYLTLVFVYSYNYQPVRPTLAQHNTTHIARCIFAAFGLCVTPGAPIGLLSVCAPMPAAAVWRAMAHAL